MKKLLTLILLVSLCLSGCALGNNVSEGENAMTISDFKKDASLISIPESSGPAIGGLNNAESLRAAETLKKLIEESEKVADYGYEGYYLDLDSKINMGIKDGVPYYNEEFCDEIPDLL